MKLHIRMAKWGAFVGLSMASLTPLCQGAETPTGTPLPAPTATPLAASVTTATFAVRNDKDSISVLRRVGDRFDTNYIAPQKGLGEVLIRYRGRSGGWESLDTAALKRAGKVAFSQKAGGRQWDALYTAMDSSRKDSPTLTLQNQFEVRDNDLLWTMTVRNLAPSAREIVDWSMPLPMNTSFETGKPATSTVFKHSFVSGDNSYLFWMRSNSVGPFLMMVPQQKTALEYWDHTPRSSYRVYLHSQGIGTEARAQGTRWRQTNSLLKLAPAGQAGDTRRYSFKFQWVKDYAGVRQALFDNGLIDTYVAPGMTVPSDLFARFALHTRQPIRAVEAEFPSRTVLTSLGKRGDMNFYQVRFQKLGENKLTIRYGEGRRTTLEFFSTQPLETLIKKRGAFIAAHQQRDSSKWYNGLLSEWNMRDQVMLGPDNYDGLQSWRIYEATCDDPGLSKPAYLASKNAEYPNQKEVEALDYYIKHFVWGGLQRTTQEKYAYGIYGIGDWHENRTSPDAGSAGQLHLWRPYDYPHIVAMYLGMYRVAKNHPQIKTQLSAGEYLRRAYGTAIALFTVPKKIIDWQAYYTGFYNERVIPELVDILEQNGLKSEAGRLRSEWQHKVEVFVNESPDLFGSEYPFDSTGFESTQALAKYALEHPNPKIKPADARRFMEKQMAANLFCRGVLEPAYYTLGSDYRGGGSDGFTLSYMAPMGGWGVFDYGLNFAAQPADYLRLGYASYLSSWALMNTGTAESNYGFWFPGKANDGGAGGGFEPAAYGETWLDQPHHRGSWYYSCETDLGYTGALRSAATLLTDDPIFGRFCYGGDWKAAGDHLEVMPKDGLRKRFYAVLKTGKLQLTSETARFAASRPIVLKDGLTMLRFYLESERPDRHNVRLRVKGLKPGAYSVTNGRVRVASLQVKAGSEAVLLLPLSPQIQRTPFSITRQ